MTTKLPLEGGADAPAPFTITVKMSPYQAIALIDFLAAETGATMGKGMPIRRIYDGLVEATGAPDKVRGK